MLHSSVYGRGLSSAKYLAKESHATNFSPTVIHYCRLTIYRVLCLILIVAFRRWVSVIIMSKKCDAYFSIVSIIVMYRSARLYPVTMSFVSSETCVSVVTFSTYEQENKIEKLWRITDVNGDFLTSFITRYFWQCNTFDTTSGRLFIRLMIWF